MMRKLSLLFVVLLTLVSTMAMGQVAAWDFNGESSPATSTADVFNANMDASNLITRGSGAAASSATNSFRTQGFQNNGISTANTDYFEITLSASSGYTLSLSTIDARFAGTSTFAASPGVSSQFAYSLDGSTFTLVGSPSVTIGTPATLTQIDLTGISALQNVDAATTVTIRYYASGQTTSGGWGFNSPSAGQYGLAIGGTVDAAGGGTPTKLVVTSINNGSSPSANTAFDVVVQSQDDSNVPQTVSTNTLVTLSLATGSGALGGTLTDTILAGSNNVTFSGITYDIVESGVSIIAARTSGDVLTADTSSTFTVLEAATKLALVNVPTSGQQSSNLSSFTVEAQRSDNSVDLNYTAGITIAKASGPGSISGTLTNSAVAGVATFNNIQFDAGGSYTISASADGLTGATSGTITILSTSLPLVEDFSYTSATTLTSNGWSAHSGSGTNAIAVTGSGLTYTNYASSGVGNAAATTASGEDINRIFTTTNSGSLYLSFLVNVLSATATGDYFLHFGDNAAANFKLRVYAKDVTGALEFGLLHASGTPVYTSNAYSYSTTYLLVVKYIFNAGADDDVSALFVNPVIPAAEPAVTLSDTAGTDAVNLGTICIRQGTNTPVLTFDGLRLATTWGGVPLPVELTSFTAVAKGRGVELAWKTATEVNNHSFEIERSEKVNGRSEMWSKIGFVEGNGTTNSPKSYSFVDASASGKVAYRLKQIDRDGKFEYSNTVEVTASVISTYALDQNHPNPFNPSTKISYALSASGFVSLKVYDLIGREVATLVNGVQEAGAKVAEFNASQLPSGVYFYTLRTQNFTATKKMLLVK